MKKKTLKPWIAGLALVVMLPLTVFPGLEYGFEGSGATRFKKVSKGFDNTLLITGIPRASYRGGSWPG